MANGMVGSDEVQLLKIDQLCMESTGGIYTKCSKKTGTLTVCADQPVSVYSQNGGSRPMAMWEFRTQQDSVQGPPTASESKFNVDASKCKNHATLRIGKAYTFFSDDDD